MSPQAGRRFLLWLALSVGGLGQELDTVILSHSRRSYTILDEIEDAAQRKAFQALYRKGDPRERRKLAEEFLARHPDSWLLAQVYEIAAKASLELEDYPALVGHARRSLRLLPENPLLLVPLANVQVRQGMLPEASRSAHDALEYLDRFGRPASIAEKDWPRMADQLRASAWFALGRAAATEGLGAGGEKRAQLLSQSEQFLLRSRNLNAGDPEVHYLLGLTSLALARRQEAAIHFFAASQMPGPLREMAMAQLKKLHAPGQSLEEYVRSLAAQGSANKPEPGNSAVARKPAGDYAGSQVCRTCHPQQHSSWEQTGMARMFRPYRPENVIGDFDKNNIFADERGAMVARMVKEGGRHHFEIRQPDELWRRYSVDYTIGSKWQQAYATRLPNGEIHVSPVQYSRLRGEWLNFWKLIDPPNSPRIDVQGFNRLISATNYQLNCAPCHTSQLRSTGGGAERPENLLFREGGVNCEMCHAPSARHVTAMRSGRPYAKQPADPPVDFRRLGAREYVAICAQCHMQSAIREPGAGGEWNYSPDEPFYQAGPSKPYAEFSRKAFYKDGRFRETTFIGEALLRSACYRKGGAHCGHCHNPHPPDAASNNKSLRFLDMPDQMCLQCHGQYAARIEEHTRHPASSEASRCVSCHMPRIMNSLLFQARTHQIDDVPAADMTERFGQRDSPNACLLCHKEKEAAWLKDQLARWP